MVREQNMGNYAIMGSYTVKTELYSCIKARLVINKNSSKLSLIQPNSHLYSLIPHSFYSGGRDVLKLSYPQSLLPLISFTNSSWSLHPYSISTYTYGVTIAWRVDVPTVNQVHLFYGINNLIFESSNSIKHY